MSLEFETIKISHFVDDMKNGGTPRRSVSKYWENGTIPWLKTGEINNSPILDNSEYITEEGLKKSSAKVLPINSVIMALYGKGTAGRVGLLKFEATTNQACCAMICKDRIKSEYLYYYLLSIQPQIELLANGSVQQNLSKEILADYDINVPKNYQDLKNIVWILKNIDQKIENNKSINKNLEEQIETIYNSFFVYYDDFLKEELEECEIGFIPKDWNLMTLGQITTQIKEKVGKNNYKVFSAVNTGNLILSEEYFDKQVFSKSIEKYIVVKQDEFAYNPARINIGSIGRNDFDYEGCVSPVYVAFKVEEGYENFMNMFIKSKRFNQWVITLSSGSVRQTLNYNDFSIIKIAYPPKSLVNKFNVIYESYYEVINYNKSVIYNLEEIRDTLLPKLMSGEIDVSKINCDLKIIIRKIYIKSSKLFLWRYLSENQNHIKNTKSNETLLKSRTIYQINKFLAKFNARYRYYRQ